MSIHVSAVAVLRQRRSVCEHVRQGVQEHRLAVGRVANLSCIHRHRTDHGMGQQGHRNQVKYLKENSYEKFRNLITRGQFHESVLC